MLSVEQEEPLALSSFEWPPDVLVSVPRLAGRHDKSGAPSYMPEVAIDGGVPVETRMTARRLTGRVDLGRGRFKGTHRVRHMFGSN